MAVHGTLLALLLLAPSGCGGDEPAPGRGPGGGGTDSTDVDRAAPAGPLPDLCSLLTGEELTSLLGSAPEGDFAEGGVGGASCTWFNPTGQFVELAVASDTVPATQGVVEVEGVLFFELAGRDGNLKYVDFDTGDQKLDELQALIPEIQARA